MYMKRADLVTPGTPVELATGGLGGNMVRLSFSLNTVIYIGTDPTPETFPANSFQVAPIYSYGVEGNAYGLMDVFLNEGETLYGDCAGGVSVYAMVMNNQQNDLPIITGTFTTN